MIPAGVTSIDDYAFYSNYQLAEVVIPASVTYIGWKAFDDVGQLVKPYEKEGDCALYSDIPTTFVTLHPGQFVVAYPENAHAPLIGKGKIRKLIAKIRL